MWMTHSTFLATHPQLLPILVPTSTPKHGGRRSIRSIGRSRDRIDRFDRFDKLFNVFSSRWPRNARKNQSRTSRSISCQGFSSVRRLETEKTPKNQNEKIWIFCHVRFDRFDNPFDSIDNVPMGDGGPPWKRIVPPDGKWVGR